MQYHMFTYSMPTTPIINTNTRKIPKTAWRTYTNHLWWL